MKKEKGSILLLTIIAIAFVTVLSGALLTMTSMNVGMKYTDRTAKVNVYAAESGIEEAYAIVGREVEKILEKAETAMNTIVTGIDTQAKAIILEIQKIPRKSDGGIDEEALKNVNVADACKQPLVDPTPANAYTLYDFYIAYLKESSSVGGGVKDDLSLQSEKIQAIIANTYQSTFDTEWTKVCVGGTGIKTLQEMLTHTPTDTSSEYAFIDPETTITAGEVKLASDNKHYEIPLTSHFVADGVDRQISVVLEIYKPDGKLPVQIEEKRYIDNALWNYGLVAKDKISFTDVVGFNAPCNIYSQSEPVGGTSNPEPISRPGITFDNVSNINLKGDIITEGDIMTLPESDITKPTNEGLEITGGNIYCRSLITEGEGTTLTIQNSHLYTRDDIELNGKHNNITTTNTKYIGFSDGSLDIGTDITHDKSSAIIINALDIGSGSSLNMTLGKPSIAVGGHLSAGLAEVFKDTGMIVPGTSWIGEDKYQTGESVSIKGNYVAYTNMFDYAVAKYDKDNVRTDDIFGMPFVIGYEEGSKAKDYTVIDKIAYFNAFYETLYNAGDKEANKQKYFTFNPGNGVKIEENGCKVYRLGAGVSTGTVQTGVSSVEEYKMRPLIADVRSNYDHITHFLTYRDDKSKTCEHCGVTDGRQDGPIEHYTKVREDTKNYTTIDGDKVLYKWEGDVEIKAGAITGMTESVKGKKGIIMVDGNITITDGLDFEGMILATGSINIKGGTYNIKNYESIQKEIKEFINQPSNADYQALFKENTVYQSTTTVKPGDAGMSAYRYKDIVKITNWEEQ